MASSSAGIRPGKFFPQLEGLRAYAILFVIAAHWQIDFNPCEYWIRWAGIWGITYFYVLSGFLIGNIVLNENDQLKEKAPRSVWPVLKVFYMRRILRIFPIYYLLIFLLLLIGFPSFIYKLAPWLLFHCSNIYIFLHGWIWPLTHLWSLAVEEHFILVFPMLIFFIPKRFVVHAILIMGLSGIICRSALYLLKEEFYQVFTLSSFDSLAIGVLLAHIKIRNISVPYMKAILLVAFALYVFLPHPTFMYFTGKTFLKVLVPSAAVFSMGIIFFASEGKGMGGIAKYLFENKLVLYIGKIGYGIYLYHLLIPDLRIWLMNTLECHASSQLLLYAIDAALLLLIATLSFFIIEKPIYSLKKHFRYTYSA